MKLLLAEDDLRNRDMLSRRLRRRGLDVIEAVDGLEAVSAAQQSSPDIILMDLAMPNMNGWDAIERIRSHDVSTPIIVLTAHSLNGERARALSLGAQAYLTKPVDFDALLDTLEKLANP
ncbi:response regulator [Acidihalobacter ferrooxydans]|uniref:Response regulatory domain-containing protein n=1 Tax=Acidihalobacter ferrooxydans TaxID=1765967 RepID=A0A1P8UKB9_9GAMM|nr:response regulator [Acidihalobacter ferrooxydans]APZ44202.1 hypothetical protein BW247_14820 [Acidihalobacter ferrooxydans]